MQGFGVHTSMWTMKWDRNGAESAIQGAIDYSMDFLEIALLDAPSVDPIHTRNLLEKTAGQAAKARLEDLLKDADLHVHSHGKGKYGRILGVLYNGKKNIFTTMLKEGHLREYNGGKREPWF